MKAGRLLSSSPGLFLLAEIGISLNQPFIVESILGSCFSYNIYLRLCADLANRDKHLTLDENKRDDGEITSSNVDIQMQHTIFVSGTDLRISLLKSENGKVEEYDKFKNDIEPIISQNNSSNSNAAMLNQSYVVTADNGRIYDAFSLAEECYKAWINFLIQHNLPKP